MNISYLCRKTYLYGICLFFLLCGFLPLLANESGKEIFITLEKESTPLLPLQNISYYPLKKTKIALVLSGGGARGLSHIGVLKALEEHNIPVNLIVGTSIGSIVGGFYAAGFSADEIRKIVEDTDLSRIFNDEANRQHLFLSQKSIPRRHLIQFRLDGIVPVIPSSITQGQRVFQTFYNQLLKANFQAANDFNSLKIPFRSVATDLISGEKVVLDHGDLAEAMNASMAFPLFFAPVEIDSMMLVDGGMTDNLPVDVAIKEGADVIIAVDATSSLRKKNEINAPWEVADQVTTIMMQAPTEESRLKADIVLQPELERFKGGDFKEVDLIVRAGYQAALSHLDSLKALTVKNHIPGGYTDKYLGRAVEIGFKGVSQEIFEMLKGQLKFKPLASPLVKTISHGNPDGIPFFQSDIIHDLNIMYESGYFEDVAAGIQGAVDQRTVMFVGKEQPQLTDAHIRHSHILPASLIEETKNLLKDKRLNIKVLHKQLKHLRNQLIQKGHSLAEIKKIEYKPESRTIFIDIDEGYIENIKIVGNHTTRNSVIIREFPLKAGELFQAARASQGINNIYSTNLFDRVLINLENENDKHLLIIKVKEKKYALARLGAHYSLERKTEGFLELLEDNFLGTGSKVSVFGSIGDFVRRVEALFYTVRLYKTFLTARLRFYYDERRDRYFENFVKLEKYRTIRRGAKFSIGQQIQRLGLISAELRLEDVDLQSPNPGLSNQRSQLRTFAIHSVVDKRDRLPFPNSGVYNRWFWEAGSQQILGSNVSYTKIFLGLEGYYPATQKFNLHPYVYGGTADLTLPFSEFFFLGGQKKFPGLYQKEIFGRQYIHGGIDLRYRLDWSLPIEAFIIANYSTGAAWETAEDRIGSKDFLHSVSASIAINSLLGPVQLTYSKLFEKRDLLYFSLGFDF